MRNYKSVRPVIGLLCLVALFSSLFIGLGAAPASAAVPPLAPLKVKSAILLDFSTGQALYAQDADQPIPPASLTKLMTLHLAYKAIEAGTMKRDDKVNISKNAWAANWPGSSLMFLEPGQNVTVGEIMKGIAIDSGNDAAVALAEHMAGTVPSFVDMMNKEAQALGYKTMHFVDPAGLDPKNMVTAREYADFARKYIMMHPESLQELHAAKQFSYPLQQNLAPGKTLNDSPTITQPNRNNMLWTYDGADGLKTGFIDEAGYNMAATAKRGDMRLIAIVLGAPGSNDVEGSKNREAAAAAMLDWGFQNFTTVKPPAASVKPVRVWKGAANEVTLVPEQNVQLTVERGTESKLTATVQQETTVNAPVKKGDVMGQVVYSANGKEVATYNLVAASDVKQGGIFKRLWDSLLLWASHLIHRKK